MNSFKNDDFHSANEPCLEQISAESDVESWLKWALQIQLSSLKSGLTEALRLADPNDPFHQLVETHLERVREELSQLTSHPQEALPELTRTESPARHESTPSLELANSDKPHSVQELHPVAPLDELEAVQSDLGHPWLEGLKSLLLDQPDESALEAALRSFRVRTIQVDDSLSAVPESDRASSQEVLDQFCQSNRQWALEQWNEDGLKSFEESVNQDSKTALGYWSWTQRCLLRDQRARERAQDLIQRQAKPGWSPHLGYTMPLPFCREDLEWDSADTVLLPGMIHAQGWKMPGFRLSDLPEIREIERATHLSSGPVSFMARWMAFWMWLLNEETTLFHGLKGLNQFMIQPIGSKNRRGYQKEMLRRFTRSTASKLDENGLKLWIDFHESLSSLLYLPPTSQETFLGRLGRTARFHLKSLCEDYTNRTGAPAFTRLLLGSYSEINDYTDQQTNLPIPKGGDPGEVAVCLRLYAEINHTAIPGRVLYGAH